MRNGKYIIEGIYNVHDGEYKVTREYGGIRRIEFSTNCQIPLINSLSETIRSSDGSFIYFADKDKINLILIAINNAIIDYFHPGGRYYSEATRIKLDKGELSSVMYQLACQDEITKFAKLSDEQFLLYIKPCPITVLVKVVNGEFLINIYTGAVKQTFDIDDGYSGLLSSLNEGWNKWKEVGDITAPILEPNYI